MNRPIASGAFAIVVAASSSSGLALAAESAPAAAQASAQTSTAAISAQVDAILANAEVVGLRNQPELILKMDNPQWARALGITGTQRRYKGLCGDTGAQATIGTLLDHARRDLERELGGASNQQRGGGSVDLGLSPTFRVLFDSGNTDFTQNYLPNMAAAADYIGNNLDNRMIIRVQAELFDFTSDGDPNNDGILGSAGTVFFTIPWQNYVRALQTAYFRAGDVDFFPFSLPLASLPVRYDGSSSPTQENEVLVSAPQLRAIFGENVADQFDATFITFNSAANWEFNNDDCGTGPASNESSLVDVAVHEYTHSLGFASALQPFSNSNNPDNQIFGLDVARFLPGDAPSDSGGLFSNSRIGEGFSGASDVHVYADPSEAGGFETFLEQGDNAQPAHLQSRNNFGDKLGIMDPFLNLGTTRCPDFWTRSDYEPLKNMGWRKISPVVPGTDCNLNGVSDHREIDDPGRDNDGDFILDDCEFFNTPIAEPTTPNGALFEIYTIPSNTSLNLFDPSGSGVSLASTAVDNDTSRSFSFSNSNRRVVVMKFFMFAPQTDEYAFRTGHTNDIRIFYNGTLVNSENGSASLNVNNGSTLSAQFFLPLAQGWHEFEVRMLSTSSTAAIEVVRESNTLGGWQVIPASNLRVNGNANCNAADLAENFGILDLADINAFVSGFTTQDPIGDIDGNGIFDLSDINAFVTAFTSGCP